jgi:CubicO group peptidase (beta-lactamase class C family)
MSKLISFIFLYLLSVTANLLAQTPNGKWQGTIEIPSSPLDIIVHFNGEGDSFIATMDIPVQKATNLKLSPISYNTSAKSLEFKIADAPGDATFAGIYSGDSIVGTFTQGGYPFPMKLFGNIGDTHKKELKKINKLITLTAEIADSLMRMNGTPGVAIAIFQKDTILYMNGLGMSNIENKTPVSTNTVFAIGSCTKAFTAMALALQQGEGKLKLSDKVTNYISGFSMFDSYATAKITVEDLLCHRSGLPRHDMVWYGATLTRSELLKTIKHLEPTAELREKWQYQNLMYMVAGIVSESIDQTSWEELIAKRIFVPLKMKNTGTAFSMLENNKNAAKGYKILSASEPPELIPYKNIEAIGPAGSINSTISDMTLWGQSLLNGGTVDSEQILPLSAVRDVLTPRMVMGVPANAITAPLLYSLGWIYTKYHGHDFYQHGGNIDGFSALIQFLPEDNIGFVVLTNQNESPLPAQLALYLTDVWLEKPASILQIPTEEGNEETKHSSNKAQSKPHHSLEKYCGDYFHPAYGSFQVSIKDNNLNFDYHDFNGILSHLHFETFQAQIDEVDESIAVNFITGIDGYLRECEIAMEPELPPLVFQKLPDAALQTEAYLKEFSGTFSFDKETVVVISTEAGKLMATITTQGRFQLLPKEKDVFTIVELNGYSIAFNRNKKGEITSLSSIQPNGTFTADKKEK